MWQDLRYGLRLLLTKGRGFTLFAVLSLALGIGANTAIFSIVNAVLLRPLPYPDPDRLARVWMINERKSPDPFGASYPDFLDWQERNRSFAPLAGFFECGFNLGGQGEPERLPAACVSAGFLPALGVRPLLGRNFLPAEDRGAGTHVAILSHALWQQRFGGARDLIGQRLLLDGVPYLVVGILPPELRFPDPSFQPPAVLVPLALTGWQNRAGRGLAVFGRIGPGISFTQAREDLDGIARRLAQEHPDTNTGFHVRLVPLHQQIVGNVRSTLMALLGAVSLVLLIACVNLANLLLARGLSRNRELAIRVAVGAGRARVMRQLITESLALALLGGLAGVLVAWWSISALVALGPADLPRLGETVLDGRVLIFALLVSLATGLLFGLAPALQLLWIDLFTFLKEGGRGAVFGIWQRRIRGALVAGEVALAMMLLIGAGLLTKSLLQLQEVSPGFEVEHILTAEVSLGEAQYPDYPRWAGFFTRALDRVAALPGAQAVSAAEQLPLSGEHSAASFHIEGRPLLTRSESPQAEIRLVWPQYFRALGIPLLQGRDFTDGDRQEPPGVVIVNQEMARQFWPGEDPIGKHLTLFSDSVPRQVIGIVGDVRHFGLADGSRPEMYVPYTEGLAQPYMNLVVRTTGDPLAMAGEVRRAVLDVDPEQPLGNVRSMEQLLSSSLARPRFRTLLISLFALGALLLAAIGIYGVLAYSVHQLQHEIAIRMALGATPVAVFRMVTQQALTLVTAGMVIGVGCALLLAQLFSGLLFQVSAFDFGIILGTAVLLLAVALAASYFPARRATRIDSVAVLH